MSYTLLTEQLQRTFSGVFVRAAKANTHQKYVHHDFVLHVTLCTDPGDEELRIILLQIKTPAQQCTGEVLIQCLRQFCVAGDYLLTVNEVTPDTHTFWESLGFVPLIPTQSTQPYIYIEDVKHLYII